MKIVSFDVGIRNLAYCYIEIESEKHYKILDWKVIDLCYGDNIKNRCTALLKKNNNVCGKQALFRKNKNFFCKTHAKNNKDWIMPTKELKINKSTKYNDLLNIINKYKIPVDNDKQTKKKMYDKISEFLIENCLEELNTSIKVKAANLSLIEIGKRINTELKDLFNLGIDYVIIENQIGPLAARMKSIQSFIAMFFIMNNVDNIEFISASNKLCQIDKSCKDKYAKRKILSIQKTKDILGHRKNFYSWYEMFISHKKKDDLADCFLQCLWFITDRNINNSFKHYF